MGLSKHQKYSLSEHAISRYRERFNPNDSDNQILSRIRNWLAQADFMSNEPDRRQSWINKENKVVIVVQPNIFTVITLYSSELEVDNSPIGLIEVEEPEKVHSKAEKIVSDLVKEKYRSVKTDYYEQLASLYVEYGERLDKLVKTFKPSVFKEKEIEAEQIKQRINDLEQEHKQVTKSLNTYILKEKGE